MTIDKKIADRIKKLMALGGSDNEHEARAAMDRVQKLLVEHNLTRADIAMTDYHHGKLETKQKRRSPEDRWVDNILVGFFNVRLVIGRNGILHILGTDTDVEIAIYTRAYLKNTFKASFRAMKLPAGSRSSFYYGFYRGLQQQLKTTQAKASATQEQGLVLVKHDRQLREYQAHEFPRVQKHQAGRVSLRDSSARAAGFEQGQSMSIRRGVGSGSGQALLN